MTKEELLEIFDWLEENANQNKLLYFKIIDNMRISGYLKINNHRFADFYIHSILEIMRSNKDE